MSGVICPYIDTYELRLRGITPALALTSVEHDSRGPRTVSAGNAHQGASRARRRLAARPWSALSGGLWAGDGVDTRPGARYSVMICGKSTGDCVESRTPPSREPAEWSS